MIAKPRFLIDDLIWGIGWGLGLAALFCLWVALITMGQADAVRTRYGATPTQIMVTYLVVGGVGGTLLGCCRPLTRHRLGAFLVGTVVGTMLYFAVGTAMTGFTTKTLLIASPLGIIVGGGLGVVWRDQALLKHRA
jgi:hypothetical protein